MVLALNVFANIMTIFRQVELGCGNCQQVSLLEQSLLEETLVSEGVFYKEKVEIRADIRVNRTTLMLPILGTLIVNACGDVLTGCHCLIRF
jgi:hypothetical protein